MDLRFAVHVDGNHGGFSNAGKVLELPFDFFQGHAHTVDFHLVVAAAHIFQLAVGVPSREVAGMIDGSVMEAARSKLLGGQFGSIPIARRDLRTRQPQFAHGPLRQEASGGVHHKGVAVVQRAPDGDGVVCLVFLEFEIGRIHGKLGGSVGVVYPPGYLGIRQEPFSPETEIIHAEGMCFGQCDAKSCGEAAPGDVLLVQEQGQFVKVHPDFGGDEHEAASHGQHGEEVFHRGVEGQVGMAGDATVGVQGPSPHTEVGEVG